MFLRVFIGYLLALGLTAVIPVFAGNDKDYNYLALGDSISFGLNPTLLDKVPPPVPADFIGYPETVADIEHLLQSKKEVNASCPGETSGSFLNVLVRDNGCNSPHLGVPQLPPFKTTIGLHTAYTSSQMEFAASQLANNKHINLITLGIGGNDLLLLQEDCAASDPAGFTACVAAALFAPDGSPGLLLTTYGSNLAQILTQIRAVYSGTLVLVEYYSPSTDPLFTLAITALNRVMMQVGGQFGVKFADGFTAFQFASAPFGGDPCAAGLLIHLNSSMCDIHPSQAGRDLLAATVLFTIGAKY
jgi:lysophospholipase L1-like esterase